MSMTTNKTYLIRLRASDPKPVIRVEASSLAEARRISLRVLTLDRNDTLSIEEESV